MRCASRRALVGAVVSIASTACGRVGFDAHGDALAVGCDAPGGQWSDVPGGGFESGDIAGWDNFDIPNVGTATVVQSPVAVGSYAVRMTPAITAFSGYSLAVSVAVTSSTRYVLSAYLDASGLSTGQALYLDLNDTSYEIDVGATVGAAGWQFVAGTFTVPAGITTVEVRVVHDGTLTTAESAYADEIALTPEATFAGPGMGCR
jgi:hypothetical protein